ncbi:Glycine betaine transport ATP-binding protein OpuAA [bioreactor metagenome]|uniref:Glycine betaine transport ATP-binding protein OpuAA n=1 Tax=bioreactor metagenome TaxID=1076179 RepID=A0A645BBE4_9ZZZZ|nr:betaine/proline/choline family ABC transporter ATP-binding protein [Candidatus Metalachnospira sp.]
MCDIALEAKSITKIYGHNKAGVAKILAEGGTKNDVYKKTGSTVALWDVNFKVKKGEIFVVIGLSGSGKSTIIRCFNQLVKPTSGQLFVDGKNITDMNKKELIKLRREKISMVFQNFGLFTHRSVIENVAYGPELRGMPKRQRDEEAGHLIKMVGLEGLENKSISSLSGGMKQRVGIARALANDPEVLLMDEPFSALDPLVRRNMQFELLSMQRKLGKTILFITHDINEAFKLGDTVAIMRDGKIVQIDTPENMAANPANEYVEQFIKSADKTQILSAKNVKVPPACLVRNKDEVTTAIREMNEAGLSSAYVVDNKMRLIGIITIDSALKARETGTPLAEMINNDIIKIAEDTLLSDILPLTAEARYPIAVVDDAGTLTGIVTKSAVIASII